VLSKFGLSQILLQRWHYMFADPFADCFTHRLTDNLPNGWSNDIDANHFAIHGTHPITHIRANPFNSYSRSDNLANNINSINKSNNLADNHNTNNLPYTITFHVDANPHANAIAFVSHPICIAFFIAIIFITHAITNNLSNTIVTNYLPNCLADLCKSNAGTHDLPYNIVSDTRPLGCTNYFFTITSAFQCTHTYSHSRADSLFSNNVSNDFPNDIFSNHKPYPNSYRCSNSDSDRFHSDPFANDISNHVANDLAYDCSSIDFANNITN
jgi:hypothetical protein